ncbi:MAG: NAD(P)-binding domain-containing protein [Burkholderiaceae bacterium]
MNQTLAVIGVGAMGGAMAARAHERGRAVLIRDIDPAREAPLAAAGLTVCPDPATIGAQADLIFIVVVTAAQIDDVLQGPQGLLAGLSARPAGATRASVCLCSTIAPEDTERLSAALVAAGARAIDSPISGGPARARSGAMSMMLAAPQPWLDDIEPVLADNAAARFRISARQGDAMRAKLVNNLAAGANLAAAAEVLALASKVGLDPAQTLSLMAVSSGQSWMCDDRMTRALQGDFDPRAAMPVLTKDLRLGNEMAARAGLTLTLGGHAHAHMQAACDAGMTELDDAAMLTYFRERFGVR